MTTTALALLKRYIESTGVTAGAAEAAGISRQLLGRWSKTDDGKLLIAQWKAAWGLRTWRQRPDLFSKALVAVEQGLDGHTEQHRKEIRDMIRDEEGNLIIDPKTGEPRYTVREVETKTVKKTPDMRCVAMILGGEARTPEEEAASNSPIVQITDDLDDTI